MERAVVYHYFNFKDDGFNVWDDLNAPIIPSIAVLRGNDAETPIFVLDCSPNKSNWGDWPRLLNFEIVPVSPYVPRIPTSCLNVLLQSPTGMRLCSRAWTIPEFSKKAGIKTTVFSDCDVYWKVSPFPLDQDPEKFCCGRWNNGVFYFNIESPAVRFFVKKWQSVIRRAIVDRDGFGKMVRDHYYPDAAVMQDEMGYVWLIRHEGGASLVNFIAHDENHIPFYGYDRNFPNAKNLHCVKYYARHQRHHFSIWVKEFWESIQRSVPDLKLQATLKKYCVPSIIQFKDINYYEARELHKKSIMLG